MQQSDIIKAIEAKSPVGILTDEDLQYLTSKYPYASTFHVLRAIGLKKSDHIDAKSQLNLASVYIQDRSKLYEYVVRKSLLDQISLSEALTKDEEESPEVFTETTEANDTVQEPELEPTVEEGIEVEAVDVESPISATPLEEEILREAIVHVSEIEANFSLEELDAEKRETSREGEDLEADAEAKPSSFGAWLMQVDGRKSESEKESKPESRALIEKFIQESPQITPVKTAFFSPSQMGKMSLVEDESFVTETLANVYERQGDYKKAVRAYQNLGLKYPEKRAYFANLQKKAEEKIKNN